MEKIALTPGQRAVRREVGRAGQGQIISGGGSTANSVAAIESAQAARHSAWNTGEQPLTQKAGRPKASGRVPLISGTPTPRVPPVSTPNSVVQKPAVSSVPKASRFKSAVGRAARGFGRLSRFGKAGVIGAGAAALGAGFVAGRSKYASYKGTGMSKQAILEQIMSESFNDELQKSAASASDLRMAAYLRGKKIKSALKYMGVGAGALGLGYGAHALKDAMYGKDRKSIINPTLFKSASHPILQAIAKNEEDYKGLKDKYHTEFGRRNRSAMAGLIAGSILGLAGKRNTTRVGLSVLGGTLGAGTGAAIATSYSRKKNPAFGEAFDRHIEEYANLAQKADSEKDRLTGNYKSLGRTLKEFRKQGF